MILSRFSLSLACFVFMAYSLSFDTLVNGFPIPIQRYSTTIQTSSTTSSLKMVPAFTNDVKEDSASKNSILASSATTAAAEYDWSFLDRVYLITCPNADPDGNRLKQAEEILKEANLWNLVEIKSFDTDDEDRIRGCYTSHISVLKDAKRELNDKNNILREMFQNVFNNDMVDSSSSSSSSSKKKILVLEDNIALTGNLDIVGLKAICDYMDSDYNNWDVMHLSYIPYVPSLVVSPTPDNDRIVQLSCGIGSALGTTAYIIQEDAIDTLIRQDKEQSYYAAIPDVMAELFPNTRYAAFPTPFLRAPKTKSLVNPQLDDLREILFQPIITSTVQSILAKSGISTNQLLPLTIVSLLSISSFAGKMSWDAITSIVETGTYDGPILLVILSFLVTFASLAIIVQGILLAPQPPQTAQTTEEE